MALIKCKECGSEISSDSSTCPKCGKLRMPNYPPLVWGVIIFLILGAIIIGVLSLTNY